jgi:hypothetical protein
MTDAEFLRDLAKRRCTVQYGQEQRDAERLEEIAAKYTEKTFVLHWLHGEDTTIVGTNIKDAFNRSGLRPAGLDYFEEVTDGE